MTTKFGVPQNSSGVAQTIPVPSSRWVDPATGIPTPQFFDLILGLLNRTGGQAAPSGGGKVGITYITEQTTQAQNTADGANSLAGLAYLTGIEAQSAAQVAGATPSAEPLAGLAYLAAIEAQQVAQTPAAPFTPPLAGLAYLMGIEAQQTATAATASSSAAFALPFLLYPPADVPKTQGTSGGGGYSSGSPPAVVQVVYNGSTSGATITLSAAPTNGNLLICVTCGTAYLAAGTGWTAVGNNQTGTDNLYVWSKVAGAGESATQTPVNASPAGGIILWEVSGQNSSSPIINTQYQAEVNGANPQAAPQIYNVGGCLGLSALFAFGGGTPTRVVNTGVVDAQTTTGTRLIAAGHGGLADSPYSGIYAFYTSANNAKGVTIQITK